MAESISPKKVPGLGGTGLALSSAALEHFVPQLPDFIWIIGLCLGLALIAYSVLPVIHGWLSHHLNGCISLTILAALCVAVVGTLGFVIYKERNYKLLYTMCFSHELATGIPYEPQVFHMNVAPVLINKNGFPVPAQIDEASLRFGSAASEETKLPKRVLIKKRQAGWGYLDYVEFSPPIKPGPMTGEARYVIHFGRDPEAPLDKTLVIKGEINGAISPDGRAGAFQFIPVFGGGSDPDYIPMNCRVPPEMYYVANKSAKH